MEGICKSFGETQANQGVDFELRPGEVHALLGENGAGKSTLMSILFGLLRPDEGRILLDGEEVSFSGPADALDQGIGMVHQHFMLVPTLTVAENIAIGTPRTGSIRYPRREIEERVEEVAASYGFKVQPRALVSDLPVEDQQAVEIVRLLYRGAQILILDEPTAALGSAQVESLLATLSNLHAAGQSIVIVTHKLNEVMQLADRATVLKLGKKVMTASRGEFTKESLALAMFDKIPPPRAHSRRVGASSSHRLAISGLVARSATGRSAVQGLDLSILPGEIVGLAGVAGNGQGELVNALAGVAHAEAGRIELDGRDITRLTPLERRQAGVSIIPEDRRHSGLVLDMTVAENLALSKVPAGALSRRGILKRRRLQDQAVELIERFGIRPANPNAKALHLSGGNQQKVVIARELAGDPRLLVAASPTRGVDLGAATSIYEDIERASQDGCSVLLISPDLDEILALSDRVAVLYEGRVIFETTRMAASMDTIGPAMTGHFEGASPPLTAPQPEAEA